MYGVQSSNALGMKIPYQSVPGTATHYTPVLLVVVLYPSHVSKISYFLRRFIHAHRSLALPCLASRLLCKQNAAYSLFILPLLVSTAVLYSASSSYFINKPRAPILNSPTFLHLLSFPFPFPFFFSFLIYHLSFSLFYSLSL